MESAKLMVTACAWDQFPSHPCFLCPGAYSNNQAVGQVETGAIPSLLKLLDFTENSYRFSRRETGREKKGTVKRA